MNLKVVCLSTGEIIDVDLVLYNQKMVYINTQAKARGLINPTIYRLRKALVRNIKPQKKPSINVGKYYCPYCKKDCLNKKPEPPKLLDDQKSGFKYYCYLCKCEFLFVIKTFKQ